MTAHQDALAPGLGLPDLPDAAVEVGLADDLVIHAEGDVVGQGSKKKVGRGVFIDDNADRLKPWRETLKTAAREAMAQMHPDAVRPLFGKGTPLHVEVTFTFRRPAAHYGSGRNADVLKPSAPTEHIGFPDADKALRAVLDALTQAGVWDDDRQATVVLGRRVYPRTHRDALDIPGALIRIRIAR